MSLRAHARATLLLSAITISACIVQQAKPYPRGGQTTTNTSAHPPADSLAILPDWAADEVASHVELASKLRSNAFRYFRFVNRPFADAVCVRFAAQLDAMPMVNLHGDAHLENFAVVRTGHGLWDFDDATQGPAIIDLVRFATSIHLAARQNGWGHQASAFVDSFITGYIEALEDLPAHRPPPRFVARARARISESRLPFLAFAESLMRSVPADRAKGIRRSFDRYRTLISQRHPSIGISSLGIQKWGRLQGGIGSALDNKYLFRLEGPSPSPEDDLIVELKEVGSLKGIRCVAHGERGSALRILKSMGRIGINRSKLTAQVPRQAGEALDAAAVWVQEWDATYAELQVDRSLEKPQDLDEIAYEIGRELGRGHIVDIASPADDDLRIAQLTATREFRNEIRAAAREMADRVALGWRQFAAELSQASPK